MYCPNCISKMEIKTKRLGKLGGKKRVYVCPGCGYSEMESSQKYYENKDHDMFEETKRIINDNTLRDVEEST